MGSVARHLGMPSSYREIQMQKGFPFPWNVDMMTDPRLQPEDRHTFSAACKGVDGISNMGGKGLDIRDVEDWQEKLRGKENLPCYRVDRVLRCAVCRQ